MIDIKALYVQAHYSHVRFMAERASRLHPEATWNYGMTTVGRLSCCVIERIGEVGRR